MIKPVLLLLFALNLALANLTSEGQTAYDAGDEQRAAQIWQKACEAGEARGCARLGFLYQSGKGVEQDDAKAAKFYEKACEGGFGTSCAELGDMLFYGRSVKKDVPHALELFEKACLLWRRDGPTKPPAQALPRRQWATCCVSRPSAGRMPNLRAIT